MEKSLNKLEELLKQKHPYLFQSLKKGLETNAILSTFQEVNLSPSNSLLNIYQWHNGTKTDGEILGDVSLVSLFTYFPLEVSVEQYQKYALKDDYWPKDLFPLFFSGSGDYYLISLTDVDFELNGIYIYSLPLLVLEPELAFDSLEIMIESLVECYENDFIFYTETEGLRNTRNVIDVYRSKNKKSKYW